MCQNTSPYYGAGRGSSTGINILLQCPCCVRFTGPAGNTKKKPAPFEAGSLYGTWDVLSLFSYNSQRKREFHFHLLRSGCRYCPSARG